MRHLKTYNILNDYIKIGSWCVLKSFSTDDDNIKKFMLNPSKVIKFFYIQIPVFYELECDNSRSFFNENQIDYHSKNKEDVEDFIIAKKYNL